MEKVKASLGLRVIKLLPFLLALPPNPPVRRRTRPAVSKNAKLAAGRQRLDLVGIGRLADSLGYLLMRGIGLGSFET